jgi:N6-adenosine-specific RNA methylase IME4
MSRDLVIAKLDTARLALAEAKTIQATKKVMDMASAMKIYAKRQEMGEEAIGYAHEIKIEALAQLGGILGSMEKNKGQLKQGPVVPHGNCGETPKTLAELGITKKTSMVAQQLAALPVETQEEIAHGLTTIAKETRQKNREEKTARIVANAASLPQKVYQVLYADPPWRYDYSLSQSRDIENQYPTMDLQAICQLPIQGLIDANAVLFLWVTSPKLTEGLQVLEAWGFEYRTSAVWDKEKIGMGYYFRQQHEILLVGAKGSLPPPAPSDRIGSVFRVPRAKHSEKPQEVIECLTAMYPYFQKLELFARRTHPAWEAWGYEA